MSTMRFINGPAQGETIEISVEPHWTRWYCEFIDVRPDQRPRRATSFWVVGHPPAMDEGLRTTRYEVEATMPDPENEGETIYTYGVKEED
jgi:hypothetical protein